jgi:hypothetical protein
VPKDQEADFITIHTFYRTIEGRYPEKGLMWAIKKTLNLQGPLYLF